MPRGDQLKNYARSPPIVWLVVPVWVVLAVEMIGVWRFGKDMYSGLYAIDVRRHYWTVVSVTLGAVIVSPLLVLSAFLVVHRNRARYEKRLYSAVLLLLTFSLLVSMFSCVWSCGGHPTWTSGFR